MSLPEPLQDLITEFQRLPGIGAKSAQRLAFHILKSAARGRRAPERGADAGQGARGALLDLQQHHRRRSVRATAPARRAIRRLICVVEEPQNVTAIEKTREFRGVYHVLMGALSPLQGIGPDDLKIKGLLARVERGDVEEVVLATNPNVGGRSDGDLSGEAAEAARRARHAHRHGRAGGQRSRVRRRGHDGQVDGRPARSLSEVSARQSAKESFSLTVLGEPFDCLTAPLFLVSLRRHPRRAASQPARSSPRRASSTTPIAVQNSTRTLRTIASVTPVALRVAEHAVSIPVPASSTPSRIGTNLKTTVVSRFTVSRMKATSSVGGAISQVSVTKTSATPAA